MKVCAKCKKEKPKIEFGKRKSAKDGLQSYCKECRKKVEKNFYRTEKGLITQIYGGQKYSSKKRPYGPPQYTKKEFIDWILSQNNFEKLYNNWKESGYKTNLIPSVDRLDDYKGYSLNNIQLITFKENCDKAHLDMIEGRNNKQSKTILQYDLEGIFLKEYYSITEASRQSKVSRENIGSCLNKRSNRAGQFIWKFKTMEVK